MFCFSRRCVNQLMGAEGSVSGEHLPIGIFDSGVGGLTVLREVQSLLPAEQIIYLGDTARLPYGTKSSESVQRYARHAAEHLVERGIKLLSSPAIPRLRSRWNNSASSLPRCRW